MLLEEKRDKSHIQGGPQTRLIGSAWMWAPAIACSRRPVLAQGWHVGAMCLEVKPQCHGQVSEAQRGGTKAFQELAEGAPSLWFLKRKGEQVRACDAQRWGNKI